MVSMCDKARRVGCISGDAGALSECHMKTLTTPDYIVVQVRCYG